MAAIVSISREPEDVIIARNGAVLGRKTVLKSDHFPGCQNKRLLPHVEGAPNYRQVADLPIYGVAIPTADGIRHVLDLVGASREGGRRVLWHNMREEPVIYINGRPFVLREVERPFTNLEYTGIDRARVEQMESRLKQDALQEAARYGNKIMVSDELPDGQMVDLWEPIGPNSVMTPLEVYEHLQEEGYDVDYERVPVTDEKSPKERDFDLLVQRLGVVDKDVAQLFNCQMGRGRTTTGMVVATLIYLRRTLPSQIGGAGKARPDGDSVQQQLQQQQQEATVADTEEGLRRGEYAVIRSLTRVLEGGVESKRQVDAAIDKCSAMQNLREAILGYRNSIHRQADEKKREAALSFFMEYLERYYFLICFAVYIHTDPTAMEARARGEGSFQPWMRSRPELYSILRRLLRRDPMRALGYQSTTSLARSASSAVAAGGRSNDMATILANRSGSVLGLQTVLKSDHCPGCQSLNLEERVDGAPNFRRIRGFPVYGVANPTVDGIRAVLKKVTAAAAAATAAAHGAAQAFSPGFLPGSGDAAHPNGSGPGSDAGTGGTAPPGNGAAAPAARVLWHNMREEPMVYINGKPFVLREMERPFKNMLEYSGIDKQRVEQMEARLKEDVLREAATYDGAIMVNHETEDGEIFDVWERVTAGATSSVQTPVEVYQSLQAEGYAVEYERVPITDGKAPKSRDFDALAQNIAAAGPSAALVFNCQMGRGRTTTGTVIACLVLLRCRYGRPLRLPPVGVSELDQEGKLPRSDSSRSGSSDSGSGEDSPKAAADGELFSPSVDPPDQPMSDRTDESKSAQAARAPSQGAVPAGGTEEVQMPPPANRPATSPSAASASTGGAQNGLHGAGGAAEVAVAQDDLANLDSHQSESLVDMGFMPLETDGSLFRAHITQEMAVDISAGDAPGAVKYVPQTGVPAAAPAPGPTSTAAASGAGAAAQVAPEQAESRKRSLSELSLRLGLALDEEVGAQGADKEKAGRAVKRRGGGGGAGGPGGGDDSFSMKDIVIVRRIARLLERGVECQEVLDRVVDRCAAMQNIRQAILRYRRAFNHQDENMRVRQSALSRGMEYLERYYMLIVFTAYLDSGAFQPGKAWGPHGEAADVEPLRFKAWIRRRPDIRQMKWSMRLRPARLFTIPEVEYKAYLESGHEGDAVMEAVVKSRSGQVLGRCSILKMYIFPDLEHHSDRLPVPGAPKVNHVDGFPVHSVATPTVDGAKALMVSLGAGPPGPGSPDRTAKKAIITDLREEAVVYICGQPFVLRELDQPVSTLKHVGIEGPAVEQMERRMKEDILAEAAQMGGRILLHKESEQVNPATGQSDIIGYWQSITPRDVVTPAEVYANLARGGYKVHYRRIPLTRERVPRPADVDSIQRRADRAGRDTAFLFISHTGYGGVAYAMAIICLRLHADSQLAAAASSSSSSFSASSSFNPFGTNSRAATPAGAPSAAAAASAAAATASAIPACGGPPRSPPFPASALTAMLATAAAAAGSGAAAVPPGGSTPTFSSPSPKPPPSLSLSLPPPAALPSSSPKSSPSPSKVLPSPFSPGSIPAVSPLPSTPYTSHLPPPSPKTAARGVYTKAQSGKLDALVLPPGAAARKGKESPEMAERALRNGDYRDVMSLMRVLVHGPASKFEVDTITERLAAAGKLRDDILDFKKAAEAEADPEVKAALTEAGVRALRRYAYLIVFRAYLHARVAERGTTMAGDSAFADWMQARPELGHMLSHLRLQ